MTDLDQRIAALREASKAHMGFVIASGNPVRLDHYGLAIIDEQAAEIERLRARVAELESRLGEWRGLTSHLERLRDAEDERMNAIAQNGNDGLHYVEADAGPTPLRGRVTRRDE